MIFFGLNDFRDMFHLLFEGRQSAARLCEREFFALFPGRLEGTSASVFEFGIALRREQC